MPHFSPKLQDSTKEQLYDNIAQANPSYGSLASDELTRRGNKALLVEVSDLNKTFKSASKSNDRLSKILMTFALIQVIIGMYQFIISIQTSNINPWLGVFWAVLFVGTVYWIVRKFDREIDT